GVASRAALSRWQGGNQGYDGSREMVVESGEQAERQRSDATGGSVYSRRWRSQELRSGPPSAWRGRQEGLERGCHEASHPGVQRLFVKSPAIKKPPLETEVFSSSDLFPLITQ